MILDRILAAKREQLEDAKRVFSQAALQALPLYSAPRRDFIAALQRPRAIVAEVKKASPSKGLLRESYDPVELARSFARGGAAAISVLTEPQFFLGHLDHLRAVRDAVELPLLRKDFVFDLYQLYEARAFGADAVLLIVRVLEPRLLADLICAAEALGLAPLVEVHDRAELEVALASGAHLVGINNRDLQTFRTSLAVTEELLPAVPAGVTVVAESGIHSSADMEHLERLGVHAFLVGEALMRAADPEKKLQELAGSRAA